MRISLILCVRNGGPQLDLCLKHIAELAGPPDLEIILVDNQSDDGVTLNKLNALKESCQFKTLVVECAIPGNSAGRNAAIDVATGDLMLFIDGDCYVERNFALDWIKVFESCDVGYASGRILRYNTRYSDVGCTERQKPEIIPGNSFVRKGAIQGSNMAFTKICLKATGPFDIRFGAGTPLAGEEWEVAARASFLGFKGGYFPTPTVSHDHRRLDAETRERMLFYDYGAGAVYAKHLTSRHSWLVVKRLFQEIRGRRHDLQRLKCVAGGFVKYHFPGFKWGP